MTPELKAYIVQRILQCGIKEEDLTSEMLGSLMQHALASMDAAACKYLNRSAVRNAVELSIYKEITT